jgi:hypothetical protein
MGASLAARDIDAPMVRLHRGHGIGVSHEARRAYHGGMKTLLSLALPFVATVLAGTAHADEAWPVAGQQGLVRFVIVPVAQASDTEAYARQVKLLCEPERTCFLNFYTNASGVAVAMPLPDAIANEATATYRRSAKQGAERFLWSCRLKMPQPECF